MAHIALVGAGNMGFALLSRWSGVRNYHITVFEPDEGLRARAASLGAKALGSPDKLPEKPPVDVLVIATKPQTIGEIAARYAPYLPANVLVISIAAGIDLDAIAQRLGRRAAIIRAMPNTPAMIGEGMIVCCPNSEADNPGYRNLAERLMSLVGRVAFIEDESLMDAVTAVSGSGPAYLFHFIEAFFAAGVEAGLDSTLAMSLAKQTVFGAAKLAIESAETPSVLRQQVTSPNGTTAAALEILMADGGGLGRLLARTVSAAKHRSVELRLARNERDNE